MIHKALNEANIMPWSEAIQLELDSLEQNQTWDLVDPSDGQNVVDYKWIFKQKPDADSRFSNSRHDYNLGQNIVDKSTKLSNINFSREYFAAVFHTFVAQISKVDFWDFLEIS